MDGRGGKRSRAELLAVVERQRTLEEVVRFGPPSDVVTQDEYTHDVIVPVDEWFVVYDTT